MTKLPNWTYSYISVWESGNVITQPTSSHLRWTMAFAIAELCIRIICHRKLLPDQEKPGRLSQNVYLQEGGMLIQELLKLYSTLLEAY